MDNPFEDDIFEIVGSALTATKLLYPEARIPETPMTGYWNAHSDRDLDGIGDEPEPETELDALYAELAEVKQQLKDADGTIELLRMQLKTATEWASAYEAANGPFKDKPSIPDFMVVF